MRLGPCGLWFSTEGCEEKGLMCIYVQVYIPKKLYTDVYIQLFLIQMGAQVLIRDTIYKMDYAYCSEMLRSSSKLRIERT